MARGNPDACLFTRCRPRVFSYQYAAQLEPVAPLPDKDGGAVATDTGRAALTALRAPGLAPSIFLAQWSQRRLLSMVFLCSDCFRLGLDRTDDRMITVTSVGYRI